MATPSWQSPFCLVEDKGEEGIQVNQDALNILSQNEISLNVISVIGPAHTGKSYLLNRLAGSHGFRVGASGSDQPAGLYGRLIPHPSTAGQGFLLLDTQGPQTLTSRHREQETWIMALATLLAGTGTLIFNCLTNISQDGLDLLHSATKTSQVIRNAQSLEIAAASEELQCHLVWVIRDFDLDLVVEEQGIKHKISSDELLERALTAKPGDGADIQLFNKVRDSIKDSFPSRKCFCVPSPSQDRHIRRNLESSTESQLESEFQEEIENFSQQVLKDSHQKITGSELNRLLQQHVKVIQSGQISPVQTHTAQALQMQQADGASAALKEPIEKQSGASQPIRTKEDWEMVSRRTFETRVYPDLESSHSKETDSKVKMDHLNEVLENLYADDILKKIQGRTYFQPRGVEDYLADMEILEKSYWEQVADVELAEDALQKFKDDHQSSFITIQKTIELMGQPSLKTDQPSLKTDQPSQKTDQPSVKTEAKPGHENQEIRTRKREGLSLKDKELKDVTDRHVEPISTQYDNGGPNGTFWKRVGIAIGIGTLIYCGLYLYCYIYMAELLSSGNLLSWDITSHWFAPQESQVSQNIMENKTSSLGFN